MSAFLSLRSMQALQDSKPETDLRWRLSQLMKLKINLANSSSCLSFNLNNHTLTKRHNPWSYNPAPHTYEEVFNGSPLAGSYSFIVCSQSQAKPEMSLQHIFVAHHKTSLQRFRITQLFAIML